MSYIADICNPLIGTLTHLGKLPVHQLAGHAANVDFWICEAKHRLDLIDGYKQRFEQLRNGQRAYVDRHGAGLEPVPWDEGSRSPEMFRRSVPPLQRSTKTSERKQLRRAVCDASHRFLKRLFEEGFLAPTKID